MKLWKASDYTVGAWYNVDKIAPMEHGRAETGEILRYYQDNKTDLITAYYWDDRRTEYRKYE